MSKPPFIPSPETILASLARPTFPESDERERYIEHGRGLGYRHGQRRNRVTPCGLYVWPDEDSRSAPREAMRGETVDCPRCLAVMAAAEAMASMTVSDNDTEGE